MDYENEGLIDCCESKEEKDFILDNLITLDTEYLSSFTLDDVEFKNGIKDMSRLCGSISALVSVGLNPNTAIEYITQMNLTKLSMEHSVVMGKLESETAVKVSQNETFNTQKNTL